MKVNDPEVRRQLTMEAMEEGAVLRKINAKAMAENAKQDSVETTQKIKAKQGRKKKDPAPGAVTQAPDPDPGTEQPGDSVSSSAGQQRLFPITDLCKRPPQSWYLKGLVPQSGLGQIYGQSGAGKSFVALDLALALATGSNWFGWKFSNKAKESLPLVCYIILEGVDGFGKRVKALSLREEKRKNLSDPLPDNLMCWESPLDITKPSESLALAAEILSFAKGRKVICFIDTQAAASPAMDENSSEDMGKLFKAIGNFQRLLSQPKAFVIMIAHAGKVVDKRKGARGWSGQKAPLELMLVVCASDKEGGFHTITLGKSKDEADGQTYAFILQPIVVGKDEDGDDEVSCTVEPVTIEKSRQLTADEQRAIESLKAVYANEGVKPGGQVTNVSWVNQFARDYELEKEDAKHSIQYLASCLAEKKIIQADTIKHKKMIRLITQVLEEFTGS